MKDRRDRRSTRATKEPPEQEQQLVEQALERGGDALGVLLQRWRPWLLARARRELGGEQPGGQRPSDLVQQTCVLALRFVATFQGRSRPELRGWLATILHHAICRCGVGLGLGAWSSDVGAGSGKRSRRCFHRQQTSLARPA